MDALYTKRLQAGLSATTMHHVHTVLHTALEYAVRQGLVAFNVTDRVDAPAIRRTEMQTFNRAEFNAFLDAVEGHRFEALFVLAITTGMRQGELLGLHWQDVDLERGVVTVCHTLQHVRGRLKIADPQTASSRRPIRLIPEAIAALHAHRARQLEERLALGDAWDRASHLVFVTYTGRPLDASHVTKSFQAMLKRTGLKRLRFHDLRHT